MAHYALQKLHIRPSEFLAMEQRERAFIIASIERRVEQEKKEQEKIKHPKKGKNKRRRR